MFKIIYVTLFLVNSAHAQSGFSLANEFKATSIEGQVTVNCQNSKEGVRQVTYTCREVVLDPQPYDYFVGPKDARIDEVELKAIHQDGSTRSKSVGYNGAKGISREAFNLWISTLFQKPLLEFGKNRIQYTLETEKTQVEFSRGEFVVNVVRGTPRKCEPTYYNSNDDNDCSFQYTVCQRYFEQFNNCR